MSDKSKSVIDFVASLCLIIGIVLLLSAIQNLVSQTNSPFDDIIWSTIHFILDQVTVFTIEIPFTGGLGVICTAGGTISLFNR